MTPSTPKPVSNRCPHSKQGACGFCWAESGAEADRLRGEIMGKTAKIRVLEDQIEYIRASCETMSQNALHEIVTSDDPIIVNLSRGKQISSERILGAIYGKRTKNN